MIGVICIFTWVAPCDMHLAHGQVNDHGVDGLFAVKRVKAFDVVIADRIRNVDMILLDGLQALDGVFLGLL